MEARGGAAVPAPYATALAGHALDQFAALSVIEQIAVDEALNTLEWHPYPEDALSVTDDVSAVLRYGFWILYERDDLTSSILVWVILPATSA